MGETDITFVVYKMPLDTLLALQNVVPGFAKSGHAALARNGAIIYKLGIYRAPAQILPPRLEYEPIFSIPTKMQKPHSLKGK